MSKAIERYFRLVIAQSHGWDAARSVEVIIRWVGETVEVLVPRRFVGLCIGRGGETVMAAQRDFKVRIVVQAIETC
ncbi:MAG: KH domain-containing protein [Candidatus Geothermarchaeales archaeon]